MQPDVFEKYPKIRRLTHVIPEEVLRRDIGAHMDEFERNLADARSRIPAIFLGKLFPAEIEQGAIRLEKFLGHFGNLTIEELAKLCLIISWKQPRRVLEIGTYNGMTTFNMAINAPSNCKIYTIDLPDDTLPEVPLTEMDEYISKYANAHFHTATGSYFKDRPELNITQLWGDSTTFDYSIIDGPVDVIFIDAAHDYIHKKRDTEIALKLLAPGGIILWHNFDDIFCPDVTKYLAELSTTHNIYQLRDTLLAVYYNKQ